MKITIISTIVFVLLGYLFLSAEESEESQDAPGIGYCDSICAAENGEKK